MAFQHFSQDRLDEIHAVILELIGYDPFTRNALLAGINPAVKNLLPGGLAAPAIGLKLDLGQLNGLERLVDGSVPLKQFLGNAVGLAGVVERADILRQALTDIEVGTTGAAPVVTAGMAELQEEIVHRDDRVPFGFMTGGAAAARAVAKLVVPRFEGGQPQTSNGKPINFLGTGWLVAADLLMTNHHVINARGRGEGAAAEQDFLKQAAATVAIFDYDNEGTAGTPVNAIAAVAWDKTLDYALLRIKSAGRGPLARSPTAIADIRPDRTIAVNVIQHPDGQPKQFGIRNNIVSSATPDEIRYFTDTSGGASGSPVLNDSWEVVALHRGAVFVRGIKFQGQAVAYLNIGTQITAIEHHLRTNFGHQIPEL